MKRLLVFLLCLLAFAITSRGQVGRENGNTKLPLFVSHIPKANQSMLRRKDAPKHNFINKAICFEIKCRRTIGWRKRQVGISYADYKKRINKNARKGEYNSLQPKLTPRPRRDSIPATKDTLRIARVAPVQPIQAPEVKVDKSLMNGPVLKADSLIILNENDVLFETNSYALKGEHLASLDSIAAFMLRQPRLEVRVYGHTDNVGTEAHNLKLSTQRAETVAEYLIDKGIGTDRVSFEGFGSARPLMPNNTEAGKRKNRRVEILIHGIR
jgi:outer membrane protein OmpA-like peptidoglycan-associated protein